MSAAFPEHFLLTIPSVWSSILILLTLAVIFAGSWIMFWILSHRSTTQRYWVMLGEWGRDHGLALKKCENEPLPPPLDSISVHRVEMGVCLANKQAMLIQFQSYSPIGSANPGDRPLREGLWNILIRKIKTPWPPTGLRPTSTDASAVDLFAMTPFPLLGGAERFVVHGTNSKAAAAITRSSARGLLPPDVGLLLHGDTLALDFSDRPFDTVEFERMMAVADQIIGHLPSPDVAD